MYMNLGKLSKNDKAKVKELLKTSYDVITNPPEDYLQILTHIVSYEPKNFTTLSIKEIGEHIIHKFSQKEDLIAQLSDECLNRLKSAIRGSYYGDNVIDLSNGGDGLVVPPFSKVMSEFVSGIRIRSLKDLISDIDKAFYSKYFWCFELECQLMSEIIQKAA